LTATTLAETALFFITVESNFLRTNVKFNYSGKILADLETPKLPTKSEFNPKLAS